jgi:hypothetical protein
MFTRDPISWPRWGQGRSNLLVTEWIERLMRGRSVQAGFQRARISIHSSLWIRTNSQYIKLWEMGIAMIPDLRANRWMTLPMWLRLESHSALWVASRPKMRPCREVDTLMTTLLQRCIRHPNQSFIQEHLELLLPWASWFRKDTFKWLTWQRHNRVKTQLIPIRTTCIRQVRHPTMPIEITCKMPQK